MNASINQSRWAQQIAWTLHAFQKSFPPGLHRNQKQKSEQCGNKNLERGIDDEPLNRFHTRILTSQPLLLYSPDGKQMMVPESSQITLFLFAALVLLLIPGPAVLYIVARTVSQGRKAGFVSILGLAVGNLVHVAAASVGLSALMLASAHAFTFVKLLGAGYLIYLGIRTLLKSKEPIEIGETSRESLTSVLLQGVVVNILNPKSALFFFRVFPQFVMPSAGSIAVQILALGILFILLGIVTDSIYAILAGMIGYRLRSNTTFIHRQRYFSGAVYIALGIGTAITDAKMK